MYSAAPSSRADASRASANSSRPRAAVRATANRSLKTMVSSAIGFVPPSEVDPAAEPPAPSLVRPLALRPRLATGLPWSVWNDLSTHLGPALSQMGSDIRRSDRRPGL